MADGDLILTLKFDSGGSEDGAGPPDPVPPPMGSVGAALYRELRPIVADDPDNGWVAAHLCEAIGRMFQAPVDLVSDWEETVTAPDGRSMVLHRGGWSQAVDVDHAPGADREIDMLPFLGMLVGVQGIQPLSDTDRRAAIREREAFHRGRPAAIVSYALRYTDGAGGAVRIRERYNPALGLGVDAPYHGRIIIKRSRLLPGVDTNELTRRVLERVPAGLLYDVVITDELDYDDVRATYVDYDDVLARTTDYDDLLRG